MIENSTASRIGMKGLSKAKIVYETLAEGGITRFLAIFTNEANNIEIGPIRSARDYFLDWAEEYNLTYVHCGGSNTVITRLFTSTKIKNIDEINDIIKEKYFVRDKLYMRPHNLFSNTKHFFTTSEIIEPSSIDKFNIISSTKNIEDDINKPIQQNDNNYINQNPIKFTYKPISLKNKNTLITINFQNYEYKVEYKYDSEKQKYLRFNGGYKHIDHIDETQIEVDNIIIQKTTYKVIDDKLRLGIDTKSGGECVFITRGTHQDCIWKNENGKTKYFLDGIELQEITFNNGNLWIEVIFVNTSYNIFDSK